MEVRYYQFNRSGYTIKELATICFGLRKLLLPFYLVRLWLWKLLRRAVPVGDPIADSHLIVDLSQLEAESVRRRYESLERAEADFVRLGLVSSGYFRPADRRYPHESYSFYGINSAGSIAGVCTVMTKGGATSSWIEFYSALTDGRTLRINSNHWRGYCARRHPRSSFASLERMPPSC